MRSTLHDPKYKPSSKKYLHNDLFNTKSYNLVIISKYKNRSMFKLNFSTGADWKIYVRELQIAGWFYEEEFKCSIFLKTFTGWKLNNFTNKMEMVLK